MLDTLMSEIKVQTAELKAILSEIPEIAEEDENDWSRTGQRAQSAVAELRQIHDSLR